MSGWIAVAGLGPGAEALVTPEVTAALAQATDVVGYIPYVARIAPREGLRLHPSDNRVELDRARLALRLAAEGRQVVIVSSGDPGVFAMASALFEALEVGGPESAGPRHPHPARHHRHAGGGRARRCAAGPRLLRHQPVATISSPSP